jgi:DNA-binding Xre family transcriptional regulator
MTILGDFLNKKSINKSDVSRKTGISKSRLSELTRNEHAQIKATELYLIALAIDVLPIELLNIVCCYLKLKNREKLQ